jgi:hypothetical protein
VTNHTRHDSVMIFIFFYLSYLIVYFSISIITVSQKALRLLLYLFIYCLVANLYLYRVVEMS